VLPSPTGGEVCGIVGSTDIIFANGFESGAPTLQFLRTTKTVSGVGNPTVTITYPVAGTLPGTSTAASGTFTGPADTGIVVNGLLAYTSGNTFFVPSVPLGTGSNILQATATTLTGLTAQSSVTVTQGGATPTVQLNVQSVTGFAPFTTMFSATLGAGVSASQLKVDYDGNGTDDLVTTNPTTVLKHTYPAAGLYVVRLTVIDSTTTPKPTTYVTYSRLIVQDVAETRETLCSVYSYLRTNLAAANVADAVLAFDSDRRNHYQTLFNSISTANLPVAASRLGTIANGVLAPDYAQLKVVKTFQGRTASFPMNFTRDEHGVWRIDSL
jgi:hypothetical protein